MAKKKSNRFYDASLPEHRDESWRRWKGGTKLADELRTFYTAKHVFGRIAANNAVMQSPSATATTDAQADARKQLRGQMINAFFGNAAGGGKLPLGGYRPGGHR